MHAVMEGKAWKNKKCAGHKKQEKRTGIRREESMFIKQIPYTVPTIKDQRL